jgi:hypothetical protein
LLPPAVQRELAGAGPDRLRRIAVACAALAIQRTGVREPVFDRAVEQMRTGALNAETARAVRDLAKRLDEAYLDLQDDEKPGGRADGWEHAFEVARAAASLSFALASDHPSAVDAIYEALSALRPADEPLLIEIVATTD